MSQITASSPSYDPIGDNIRDNSKERVRFAEESSPTPKIFTPDGEEDERLARDGLLALEKRQRRKTIVNSFRLAELVPTTSTPHSSYRRKSIAFTVQSVVDVRAEEQ